MSDAARAQVELMAAGMQAKVIDRAKTQVAAELVGGPPFSEAEQDALEVGILCGFMQTIRMLQEIGALPESPAASS